MVGPASIHERATIHRSCHRPVSPYPRVAFGVFFTVWHLAPTPGKILQDSESRKRVHIISNNFSGIITSNFTLSKIALYLGDTLY
jgi:hypothetical protein